MTETDEVSASIPKIHPTLAEIAIAIVDEFLEEMKIYNEIYNNSEGDFEWNN